MILAVWLLEQPQSIITRFPTQATPFPIRNDIAVVFTFQRTIAQDKKIPHPDTSVSRSASEASHIPCYQRNPKVPSIAAYPRVAATARQQIFSTFYRRPNLPTNEPHKIRTRQTGATKKMKYFLMLHRAKPNLFPIIGNLAWAIFQPLESRAHQPSCCPCRPFRPSPCI